MTFRTISSSSSLGLPGLLSALVFVTIGSTSCQEEIPTATDPTLVPVKVTTVEVTLPFDDFVDAVRTFTGFGHSSELGRGFVAHEFEGDLEASTMVRFNAYPTAVSVRDSTGTTRPDSSLTFLSGNIVIKLDPEASIQDGPVEIVAEALNEDWHGRSANWENAIDTVGQQVPWSVPGGGTPTVIGTALWDPAEADSVVIPVDTTQLRLWADSTDSSRGMRVSTRAEGVRLSLFTPTLRLETRPSINQDTIIELPVGVSDLLFVYDPLPDPPPEGIRVGGVPAWRSTLDLTVPKQLTGPPELCAKVSCPVELSPEVVSFAGLRLTTTEGPAAFTPSDTLSMDLRSVLAPDLLPKSPLGASQTGIAGELLLPAWFNTELGHVVELPLTALIRDLLRGETEDGDPVSSTLALLSAFEPLSLEFATFLGGGTEDAPTLRLILTFSERVGG